MLIKTALSALSPAGPRARLSILIFHRVLDAPDPLFPDEVDRRRFDEIAGWLARWFNVLPLGDAVQRLVAGTLPSRAAAITFDDGYADNWTNAVPILKKHGLSATFFIASGFLNGGCMWNDIIIESVRRTEAKILDLSRFDCGVWSIQTTTEKQAAIGRILSKIKHLPFSQRDEIVSFISETCTVALPADLMMTSAQLRSLRSSGMEVGAHTVNHPILARLDTSSAYREIEENREALSVLLGEPIRFFAYPNGKLGQDYLPEHVDMVRAMGFDAAVSTNWGVSDESSDLFQLRRFTPWDSSRGMFGLRMMKNLRALT